MNIIYIESQSMNVQVKASDIYRKYGKKWNIKDLGNGNWRLTKRSDVLIDGKSYRKYILDLYSQTRLTRYLFERFRQDIETGKVVL